MARPVWEWPNAALERFRNRPELGQPESLPRAMGMMMLYTFATGLLSLASIAALQFTDLWEPYATLVTDLFWLIPGVGWFAGAMMGDALPWLLPFLAWFKLLAPERDG